LQIIRTPPLRNRQRPTVVAEDNPLGVCAEPYWPQKLPRGSAAINQPSHAANGPTGCRYAGCGAATLEEPLLPGTEERSRTLALSAATRSDSTGGAEGAACARLLILPAADAFTLLATTLPRGNAVRRRSGAAMASVASWSRDCHACSGTATPSNGRRVPGCVPLHSKRSWCLVPAFTGWQLRRSPTMASVAYWPHVEHQMVSSDIHLVCGVPSSAAASAAANADCAATPARHCWCAMHLQVALAARQMVHRHPCGEDTSACPPSAYGRALLPACCCWCVRLLLLLLLLLWLLLGGGGGGARRQPLRQRRAERACPPARRRCRACRGRW
jgi:hypothetical protein